MSKEKKQVDACRSREMQSLVLDMLEKEEETIQVMTQKLETRMKRLKRVRKRVIEDTDLSLDVSKWILPPLKIMIKGTRLPHVTLWIGKKRIYEADQIQTKIQERTNQIERIDFSCLPNFLPSHMECLQGKFSKLHVLNLSKQGLGTVEHAFAISKLILETPTLTESNLCDNAFSKKTWWPLFFAWERDGTFSVDLRGNGDCPQRILIKTGPLDKVVTQFYFEELKEGQVYFAQQHAFVDLAKRAFFPNRFLDQYLYTPLAPDNHTIRVVKMDGMLYLAAPLPKDFRLFPGETPAFYAGREEKYIKLENEFPAEHLERRVRDLQVGQSGYVRNWSLARDKEGRYWIDGIETVVPTDTWTTQRIHLVKKEDATLSATVPHWVWQEELERTCEIQGKFVGEILISEIHCVYK